MSKIVLSSLVGLLIQSSFAADNEQQFLSADELEARRFGLAASLDNKDVASTRELLAAGVKPEQGMLMRCKTAAQARTLIAHGINIKEVTKKFGFLPEKIPYDADPDLLKYFLERVPLTLDSCYGYGAYIHLLFGIIEMIQGNVAKDALRFDQKLEILVAHDCYYDHSGMIILIESFKDSVIGKKDRADIKKRFEIIVVDNESKKRENIFSLLQQGNRTGLISSNTRKLAYTNAQHRYAQEIEQYEGQEEQEAV